MAWRKPWPMCAQVRHRVGPLVHEVRAGKLATREGLSYLEAKHLLLLQVRRMGGRVFRALWLCGRSRGEGQTPAAAAGEAPVA